MPSFAEYEAEYPTKLAKARVKPDRAAIIVATASKLSASRQRYEAVSKSLGGRIPWTFIAAVHQRESGADFTKHLHNGDPLNARTVRVPAGRPLGNPPFTWEASAVDALRMKDLDDIARWDDARVAYELERFNGFGYRPRKINSPYVWSGTNLYSSGKYVRDHVFDAAAVDKQLGAMPVYRQLAGRPFPVLGSTTLPAGAAAGTAAAGGAVVATQVESKGEMAAALVAVLAVAIVVGVLVAKSRG